MTDSPWFEPPPWVDDLKMWRKSTNEVRKLLGEPTRPPKRDLDLGLRAVFDEHRRTQDLLASVGASEVAVVEDPLTGSLDSFFKLQEGVLRMRQTLAERLESHVP